MTGFIYRFNVHFTLDKMLVLYEVVNGYGSSNLSEDKSMIL